MKIFCTLLVFLSCLSGFAQKNSVVGNQQREVSQLISDALKLAHQDTLKTRTLLQKALDISQKNKLTKSTAEAYSIYGEMAAAASRNTEALSYVNKAMALYVSIKDIAGVAAMHNNLSNIHESMGDLKRATTSALNAIKIYGQLKDKAGQAKAMMNVGTIFFRQNDYKTALDYEFKALKIREELKNEEDLMYSYSIIGTMYQYMKKEQESIVYHKKSLAISEKLNLPNNIGIDNVNIAKVFVALNRATEAKSYFLNAIPAFQKIGNIRGLRHAYEGLSGVAEKVGKIDEAISWQNKAIEIFKNGDDAYTELAMYINRHRIYALQKNYIAAEKDLLASEAIVKKQKMVDELQNIKHLQLDNYLAMGDVKKAKAALDEFLVYKDSTLNSTSLKQINELKTKYETEEKENQLNKSKLLLVKKENEARTRNMWLFSMVGIALLTIAASLYSYKQQQQKHTLKTEILKIDGENKLNEQRLDISRNLHDNIGSQLTFINSFMETLKLMSDAKDEAINDRINNISIFTKEAIVELRDTVWALNSDELSFDDLRLRILNYVDKAQTAKENIKFKFEVEEYLESVKFSSAQGINLYRTIQEAVNNAIKYANATEIIIQTKLENADLAISIADNGIGFDPQNSYKGNGLYNMKKRIEELGGELVLTSKIGEGTQVQIILKNALNA